MQTKSPCGEEVSEMQSQHHMLLSENKLDFFKSNFNLSSWTWPTYAELKEEYIYIKQWTSIWTERVSVHQNTIYNIFTGTLETFISIVILVLLVDWPGIKFLIYYIVWKASFHPLYQSIEWVRNRETLLLKQIEK